MGKTAGSAARLMAMTAVVVPGFAPGTMITTDTGDRAVEQLRPGDLVDTLDQGPMPLCLCLTASACVPGTLTLRPVRIARGALGPDLPEADLILAPDQRVMVSGARAELMFGEAEVLLPARHLLGRPGVTLGDGAAPGFVQLLCHRHEILCANGLWSESLQPTPVMMSRLGAEERANVLAIWPEAGTERGPVAARRSLRGHEAQVLFAA